MLAVSAALFAAVAVQPPLLRASETMDLSGSWRFELDRQNVGNEARWFAQRLPEAINLPGSLPSQGIGDPITLETKWTGGIFDRSFFTSAEYAPFRRPGNIKIPFWLQPETHYVGASWFQRDVLLPVAWAGRHVTLSLERPHWKTTLWMDGRCYGSNDSLSVPHVYDLGPAVQVGRHVITIRVDNTLSPDIGENSHSISDHTQGNWNGIVGRIELAETEPVWVDDLQAYPNARAHVVAVRGQVRCLPGQVLPAGIRLAAGPVGGKMLPPMGATVAPDGTFSAQYSLGPDAPLWDEFSPSLHRLVAAIDGGEGREVVFGLRDLSVSGHDMQINGRGLFLRGTLECAANPRTGSPPVDAPAWERFFQIVRDHGLNHVRFHSWCPPDEAFCAADKLGVYLQVEMASWPNWSTTLGDGKPVDRWLDDETDRILLAYGNHPSFALACAANEPGGEAADPWLAGWITRHRTKDPRHLYTSGAGWPELAENDYNVRPQPRIQHWQEGLDSRINRLPPETHSDYRSIIYAFRAPVVSHEIGQWCVYPNFDEIPKYTGYLKPRNFEIFRASLDKHHMLGQAHDFLMASGKLQALCYKADIEAALRTPHMAGFQLLGLSDFPGQGTALVGVLDAFWEEKGYISAAEFRRFCNSTVPLVRLERRVFTSEEELTAPVEVAHFGARPLANASVNWRLVSDAGITSASGTFAACAIPIGAGNPVGQIEVPLHSLEAPARYKLVVSIAGTPFQNDWDIWVYPRPELVPTEAPAGITVVHSLDAATLGRLEGGASVVLMLAPEAVKPDPVKGKIALGFSSIFWNTAWTNGQAPHTLGILCDPKMAALENFPTDGFSNWQWWYPIKHAAAMILDDSPPELHPIVQVIDDWFTNRKLALVFEARVGLGRILVISVDLEGPDLDPVRRQLRSSLLHYAASPSFNPSSKLTAGQVLGLSLPQPLTQND
ncbi:MAG TPA: sugar-binding domain-containing protein [Opitutaceae bacterium]